MASSPPPSPVLRFAAAAESAAMRPKVIGAIVIALSVYGVVVCSRKMGDYDVYRRAAGRLLDGERIYRLEDPHRYLYAPLFPFLFVPLAPLPAFAGKVVWYLVNLALAVSAIRLSTRFVFPEGRAPPGFTLLLVVLSLRFLDNNVAHGQMNLLMLWLILEAYALAGRERFLLAGPVLAAAILTKVFPAILLVQIVLRRQWRFAGATVLALFVLLALPALWWRGDYADVLSSWATVVVDQATHYEMGNKINQSISAFPYRLFRRYPEGSPLVELPSSAVSAIAIAIHSAFLVPLLALSSRLARRGTPEPQGPAGEELSLYLVYATVLSPYSWKYYFVQLILPFAVAIRRLRDGPPWVGAGIAVVFLLNLLPGQRVFGRGVALLFQQYSFHFLAAAALFVLILASGRARTR